MHRHHPARIGLVRRLGQSLDGGVGIRLHGRLSAESLGQ